MSREKMIFDEHELQLDLPGNVRAVLAIEDDELSVALIAITASAQHPARQYHPLGLISAPVSDYQLSPRNEVDGIPNRLVLGRSSLIVEDDQRYREVAAWLGSRPS